VHGAYTTFSTWMVEAIRRPRLVALAMAGGLAAAALGWLSGGLF
jgi:fluoride ion exporter CrcB/FEX